MLDSRTPSPPGDQPEASVLDSNLMSLVPAGRWYLAADTQFPRKAAMGSTWVARSAGTALAAIATLVRTIATVT